MDYYKQETFVSATIFAGCAIRLTVSGDLTVFRGRIKYFSKVIIILNTSNHPKQ
jgi:hypothetical protein